MAFTRLRRALLLAACASAALLAACGGGNVESRLAPTRLVVFGDATADLGQVNQRRYTVNDGSVNIWTQQLASRYGLTLTAQAAGGTSFATGQARITGSTDIVGGAAPSVQTQIDTFLGGGGSFGANDLVVFSAGVSEVIYESRRVFDSVQTGDVALAAVRASAQALALQVRRVKDAGAQRILLVGSYNLGRAPWAQTLVRAGTLEALSSAFNQALQVALVDMGNNVLYVDDQYYFNLVTGTPLNYSMDSAAAAVCTSVDPTDAIGIGTDQVNSALCDATTILGGATYDRYVFADPIYFTPQANRLLGNYAFDRLRQRW